MNLRKQHKPTRHQREGGGVCDGWLGAWKGVAIGGSGCGRVMFIIVAFLPSLNAVGVSLLTQSNEVQMATFINVHAVLSKMGWEVCALTTYKDASK